MRIGKTDWADFCSETLYTWCAECGPNVSIDEDGCCKMCGRDAIGEGIDYIAKTLEENRQLRARVEELEAERGHWTKEPPEE